MRIASLLNCFIAQLLAILRNIMVAFGHTAVGTIVGVAAFQVLGRGDIALGLVATGIFGIISHYLADLIPHGHFFTDPKKYDKLIIWVILFDLLLPFLFILGFAHLLGKGGSEMLYILFGIGGAQLPDVLDGLRRIKLLPEIGFFKIENDFHLSTHWHGKEEKALIFGVADVWQMLVFVGAVYLIYIS